MNEEHDGTPSEEEYQRFRRMMDGMGREDLLRMIQHLTERIEADPRDAEALSARGLAYGELGEHRLAAEDYGDDGQAVCWGSGGSKTCQILQNGSTACSSMPDDGPPLPPEGERFVSIESGSGLTCGLREDYVRTALPCAGGGTNVARRQRQQASGSSLSAPLAATPALSVRTAPLCAGVGTNLAKRRRQRLSRQPLQPGNPRQHPPGRSEWPLIP